jgi:tetratricopeptide (TPR) repeat protein
MPTCFVVMGFGKKTDFSQNKTFDLDKSYKYIIKPAVEAAGYTCVRADEIQHAGNINVPMYEQLFAADLVIADLSTANLNAFFELGVRYALKPRTTIVIAEKGFKIPFDMGQVIVRSYEHLGDGIDFGEVERMRQELATASKEVAAASRTDSPVYTFLTSLTPPALKEAAPVAPAAQAIAQGQSERAPAASTDAHERAALSTPFAALMDGALQARAAGDFKKARAILAGVKAAQGAQPDPFVVQQLALCTYKSKDLDPRQALLDARAILEELSPKSSSDPETLGLWGAIHKRLFELGASAQERSDALEEAIRAYGKGFDLKNDYYNGINYAFLLDTRAAASGGDDAIADRVLAQRIRRRVLAVCDELLATGIKGESKRSQIEQEYWVRATAVEALFALGRVDESAAAFGAAKAIGAESWMVDSTEGQLTKLKGLIAAADH